MRPVLGRTFHRNENELGDERVVVLGHAVWQQQFGSDPGVIGRTILLDTTAHMVVGVMPSGFDFPGGRAFWVPQPYGRNYFSATSTAGRSGTAIVRVVGRLRAGVDLEAAQVELGARSRWLEQRFPESNAAVSFEALRLHDELVARVRMPLLMLLGAVGLVLLIATANVAGLLLARAAGRREEIAVRGALGAGRGRIVRQLVTESLLLSVGGGVVGLLLAFWTTDIIVTAQIENLRREGFADAIRPNGAVLAFAVVVTIAAGILAGVLPAVRAADDGLAGVLQSAGRSGLASYRGQRLRAGLVVGQLGLAVVLLHGAGLLLHSFVRLTAVDPGFQTEQILSFRIDLPRAAYGENQRIRAFFNQLFAGIRRHAGVLSVGAIHHLPIGSGGRFLSGFEVEGRTPAGQEEASIGVRIVSPGYFQTVVVPLLRGRGLDERDGPAGLPTVVINDTAAAQFFGGYDPIGQRLVRFGYDPIEAAAEAFTVVGVVAAVKSRGLSEIPIAEAYFAAAQVPHRQMFVVVRTAGDPLRQISAVRTEIRAIDSNLPIPEFRTLDQVVADSLDRPRFFTALLSLFSVSALTLAAVGIFGLLSFAVAQRTREIGIRVALGASPTVLVRTIVGEALVLVAIGVGIGLGGALAFARVLESELFGLSATDPLTLAGVIATLGTTAALASVIPAWPPPWTRWWRSARIEQLLFGSCASGPEAVDGSGDEQIVVTVGDAPLPREPPVPRDTHLADSSGPRLAVRPPARAALLRPFTVLWDRAAPHTHMLSSSPNMGVVRQFRRAQEAEEPEPSLPVKPSLKWAGGKRWQVPYLEPLYAKHAHSRLVEPFCGGLAVAMGLRPERALLNDVNPHVINFYQWLKKGLTVTLDMANDRGRYYEGRERFNDLLSTGKSSTAEAASLFYYLNRTGYNGLCRFNSKGGFNVPFGSYKTINYRTDFSEYREAFKGWMFTCMDFEQLELEAGDFVYADPPYDVDFTHYSKGGFGWEQQERAAEWLSTHKGPVVLSNQATPRIVKLYESLKFNVRFLDAPRRISCTGDRTPAPEVLATRNV